MTEIDMCCGTTADKTLLKEQLSELNTRLEKAEKAALSLDLLEMLSLKHDVVITSDSSGSLLLYCDDTVYGPEKTLQDLIQRTVPPKQRILDNLKK